ncbi:TetR/AcrR family transcriptional regulator [Chitinophaga sancti]|uniref:TetR/AcrR family transcriptional regulator n=1 Tax=Chitinophaga sancti TaxID=1004 RepID=A0A1K1STF1_9BACT|nr:TetR/AcrR family transcriptional regulator [Chitinophaga sancti]WQD60857.1 TetR/AcrR family transcriptional regulator [Chitinophaga sancti]WQG87015.1 TetR/AcrR family transcriptional regulator [Chitinophaga sancti]SFW87558.1 transcriptional regulator, TetR family [Chitinophaga sancti]
MEIQERILDTAFNLFSQFGTRSITMDDIAQKMGVSKKTLYAHFADKDELVTHAISRHLLTIDKDCKENQTQAEDAIGELFLVMQMLDKQFRNMKPFVLLDLQRYHAAAYQAFLSYRDNSLQSTIRQNLERGIREGLYRSNLEVDILTRYRLATAMLCFQPDVFAPGLYEMSKVQRILLEHFLYGLVSSKGFERIEAYKLQLS